MGVEKLPELNPPDLGRIEDPERPTLGLAWSRTGAHRVAAHEHPRAHIIQPKRGAYGVEVPGGRWLVARGQAAWIQSHVHHEIYSHGSAAATMIFVDEAHVGRLPSASGVVVVTPLLEQLIARSMAYGNHYACDGRAARLAAVLLDELASLAFAPLFLPSGDDLRLSRAMDCIAADVAARPSVRELAARVGTSARTLARLFVDHTGMTPGQWRTRMLLIHAVERLSRGASVTEVALDLGYASASSFTYMFRTNMGFPPVEYARSGGSPSKVSAMEP